ncbi:MAG: hypothetical protein ACUVUQ_11360 [Thermodesulfovibrionales bacterium]
MPTFGINRTIVRMVIPELSSTFRSASAAYRWLVESGYGYRKTEFLADWRELLSIPKKADVWKYIPKSKKPSSDIFVETELTLGGKYQYIGEIEYISSQGKVETKTISYLSEEVETIGDIEERFGGIVEQEKDRYGVRQVTKVTVKVGRRRR